jgi:Rod binding domain-containing protein
MSEIKYPGIGALSVGQLAMLDSKLVAAQGLGAGKGGGSERHEAEVVKAATQFEALLVQEMIKEMWATVPKEGLLSGSKEEQTYQEMYQRVLAESIAEKHSIGVKDVIIQDIKSSDERQKKVAPGDV